MKLGIIGSGNIGKSIGAWASASGYEVYFSSRNLSHAKEAAKDAGKNSKAVEIKEAVDNSDMILLSVPYKEVQGVLSEIDPALKGKILIDVTNPLSPDYSSLAVGLTTSAAEEIQKLVPEARVVKAFNTIFASVYASQKPEIKGRKVSVFLASDNMDAKTKVTDLVSKMGFDPVDVGPLMAARTLEPLALLNISLGYALGHGTSIGFSFVR